MTLTYKSGAGGLMLAFLLIPAAAYAGFGQTVSSNDPNQELSLSINKIGNISVPRSYLTVKGDLIVLTDDSAPLVNSPTQAYATATNHDGMRMNGSSAGAGNASGIPATMNTAPIKFNSGSDDSTSSSASLSINHTAIKLNNSTNSGGNMTIPSAMSPNAGGIAPGMASSNPSAATGLPAGVIKSNTSSADSFYEHVMLSGILIQLKHFPQENPPDSSADKQPLSQNNSARAPVRLAAIQAAPDSGKVLAYFLRGPWLRRLDDKNSGDIVFIKGGFVRGRVVGLAHQKLLVNRNGAIQDIPVASIIDIRSPRAFYFSVSAPQGGISMGLDGVLKETMPSRVLESQSIRPVRPGGDDDDDFGMDSLAPLSMPAPIWMPNRTSMPGFNDGSAVDSMGTSPFNRYR